MRLRACQASSEAATVRRAIACQASRNGVTTPEALCAASTICVPCSVVQ
jgi:hypothetical protein